MFAPLGLFNHLTIHKTTKPAAYYGKVTPLLVKVIQEQRAAIEVQQKQIDELKTQLNAFDQLKAEVEAIKKSMNETKITGINKLEE